MADPTFEQAVVTLLVALLSVATTAITTFVIPWLRTNGKREHLELADLLVRQAVRGVEQIFGGGQGATKKKQVRWRLEEAGLKLSEQQLDLLIEAAVLDLKRLDVAVDVPRATRRRDERGRFLKKEP